MARRAALAAIALCLGAGTGPVRAQQQAAPAHPTLPPLQAPASPDHLPGKIVYEQLVTPDLAAAKAFYGALFGWTFHDFDLGQAMTYAAASLNGKLVAGMVGRPMAAAQPQPFWLTFISASDFGAVQAEAGQNGAKLLFGPRDIPDLGQEAVFSDPQGAVFAVLNSASGDPQDQPVATGDWIWNSLVAEDPDTDAAFYHTLFGYDVYDLAGQSERQHMIVASQGYARASINPLPAADATMRPAWLGYVRVDDVEAAAAKVQSLGGKVLVAPKTDRGGGKIAIVADPAGAPFGLMTWINPAAGRGSK